MSYENFSKFKNAALSAVNSYGRSRIIIKPEHFKLAVALKADIVKCNTENDLINLLYKNYATLLNLRSRKLARGLALVLAQAWDLNITKVKTYHHHLGSVTLIPYANFAKYWGIKLGNPRYVADPLSDAKIIPEDGQEELRQLLKTMQCTRQECHGNGKRIEQDDKTCVTFSKTYYSSVTRTVLHVIYDLTIPNPVKQEYMRRETARLSAAKHGINVDSVETPGYTRAG